tara:strand:+ start:688 stop:1092 length:405 start_codon:yes stop_codon:yes gene_type:complete
MTSSETSAKRRNSDLAMIHIAAKRLFGDVSRGSEGRGEYEAWIAKHTGKKSAADLTTGERIAFIKMLRRERLIPDRGRGGAGPTKNGVDRPTSAQWGKIGGMARSMGWDRQAGRVSFHAQRCAQWHVCAASETR